jgi:hypothetical protein
MQVYQIKPEHVGQQDLHQFLHAVIAKEFEGKEYSIVSEIPLDRILPGFKGIRKIIGLNVEHAGESHAIYFDVTDVQTANASSWVGSRYN